MTRIKLRRGTAAQWTSANPILAQGEEGHETDTNRRKVGNGSAAWIELPYFLGPVNAAHKAVAIWRDSTLQVSGAPNYSGGFSYFIDPATPGDPGTPLWIEGRGSIVHGMSFNAGSSNFTNQSDHCHVQWATQHSPAWQMLQAGPANQPQRFMVHGITPGLVVSYVNEANLTHIATVDVSVGGAPAYVASGIRLYFNAYPAVVEGDRVTLRISPGLAGITQGTYVGVVDEIAVETVFYPGGYMVVLRDVAAFTSFNWNPAAAGIHEVTAISGINDVRLAKIEGELAGTNQALEFQYGGIQNVIRVQKAGHNAFVGQTVSFIGTGFPGVDPANAYGAWVREVIDADNFTIALGGAAMLHTFWFSTHTGIYASGAGWTVFKGNPDPGHVPTVNTSLWYFQRYIHNGNAATARTDSGVVRDFNLGPMNLTPGADSFALGFLNYVSGTGSAAIGQGVKTTANNVVEIGPNNTDKVQINSLGLQLSASRSILGAGGQPILASAASTRTVWMSPYGSDSTGQVGNPQRPFLTLQAAYAACSSGGTIVMHLQPNTSYSGLVLASDKSVVVFQAWGTCSFGLITGPVSGAMSTYQIHARGFRIGGSISLGRANSLTLTGLYGASVDVTPDASASGDNSYVRLENCDACSVNASARPGSEASGGNIYAVRCDDLSISVTGDFEGGYGNFYGNWTGWFKTTYEKNYGTFNGAEEYCIDRG